MFKSLKQTTTTKKLMLFLFINCTIIELFTGWVTVESLFIARDYGMAVDFTPLVTLIGAVVGEVFSFAIYAAKSVKENTKGGIIYDSTFSNLLTSDESEVEESAEDVG